MTQEAQTPETPVDNPVTGDDNIIDTTPKNSELFGKDYLEITYKDLQLDEPLVGKYNTIGDIINGVKEKDRLLREKQPEAPEEYTIDVSSYEVLADYKTQLEGFSASDSPLLQAALPAFKKHNLSQEAVDDIVSTVLQADFEDMINPEAELEKLGSEGGELIQRLTTFKSKFPEAEQGFIDQIATTAEGVKFLDKLQGMTGEKSVPVEKEEAPAVDPQELLEEARLLKQNTKNFDYNKAAQARYDKLTSDAARLQLRAN